MNDNPNQYKFREYPTQALIFGLIPGLVGLYLYVKQEQWQVLVLALGITVIIFLLVTVLTVQADRLTSTLNITRRGLVRRYHRQIDFHEIAAIHVGMSGSRDDDSNRVTYTYRVEVHLKDGTVIPLRTTYSSGSKQKEKTAQALREFIGVGGMDSSLGGIMKSVSQLAQSKFQVEQEAVTGNQSTIRETNGVHWQIESRAFGASPVTRWHSTDYTLPDHFLYLAQKLVGQGGGGKLAHLLSNRFSDTMHQFSLNLYGFGGADTPNVDKAAPITLDARLEPHFAAFGSDPSLTFHTLTAQTIPLLAAWAEKHPLRQGRAANQLAVLFGPTGLYLAVMNQVDADDLDELAKLGSRLVQAL